MATNSDNSIRGSISSSPPNTTTSAASIVNPALSAHPDAPEASQNADSKRLDGHQSPRHNSRPHSGPFYSERHPVPTIQSYWELYPGRSSPPPSPPAHDQEQARTLEHQQRRIEENSEVVTDPITGKEITICDAKYAPPEAAVPSTKEIYPAAQWTLFFEQLRSITVKYIAFVAATFILLNGCLSLPFSLSILVVFGGGVTWWRNIESAWDSFNHCVESDQGKQKMRVAGVKGNESVEWLNGVISKLWPQVNPEIFGPMVDLLEDVMQNSIPSIVTNVKVVNVGQGSTPVRVLSIRWLDEDNENDRKAADTEHGATDRLNEQEQEGEWASLEVAFSYRALPSSASASSKAKNANLLVHFYMGMNGLFGTPFPVWVELRGVMGTCRMKIQLIPNPPFVKLGTFTLLGMPKIEIAAVPMNRRFLNVMNLPVISDFIYSSIRAAAREFVAPLNYTLDLGKILSGDDTKKRLVAIGALVVHIHSASGVKAADINGKSDCYVTLSYSKLRKPLWSTRIIFSELNPVWDETAVLLLDDQEVKAAEKLSCELWDSDRFTADDILGRTAVDVGHLVRQPGKVFERVDNLMGLKQGSEMPGTVKWSIAYYGIRRLDQKLETDGADERVPPDLRHRLPGISNKPPPKHEPDVTTIPPDPAYPSGILSVQIHKIVGLERHIVSGSKGSSGIRRGESQTTHEEEEGQNLPSGYCSIILDYQKIYKTRVKPMTSKPFFSTVTERFVRDYTKTKLMICVRDSRLREEDPILGVVDLNLGEVFKNCSQISRFYPLCGGIGYGKISISLLFRSIDTKLPKEMLSTDIGSIEIVSSTISSSKITDPDVQKADVIKFATPLIKKKAVKSPEGNGWCPVHNTKGSTGFRLGVRHRHSSPLILYFNRDSKFRHGKTLAGAILWLKEIPDGEDVAISLPVYRCDKLEQFMQNSGTPHGIQVGTVDLVVHFHRGLGHSHRRAAAVEKDFRDVIEAAACVEHIRGEGLEKWVSSDNDATDTEDEGSASTPPRPVSSDSQSSSKGTLGHLKEKIAKKREERKELHRMERGAMQWKTTRTLAWMGGGIKEKGQEIIGALKKEPSKPAIETEAPTG